MMLVSHNAAAPLALHLERMWYYEGAAPTGHQERVLPNGRFQIVVDLSSRRGAISGMRSRYVVIDPGAIHAAIGIVFRPGGTRPFIPGSAEEYFNQAVPLDLVWGPRVIELHDRLSGATAPAQKFQVLEGALLGILQTKERSLSVHPALSYALEEFRRRRHVESIVDITKQAGLSRRRLSQLFREQVGITPKLYCRVLRLHHALREIASGAALDWADMALACGYYDQAHLAHEFQEFCGFSPGKFIATERPHLHHVRVV